MAAAWSTFRPNRRRIGMVFQNYALFPHLSVFENVAYGLRARKAPNAASSRRAWAEMLEPRARWPALRRVCQVNVSGGQQQRVALARALAIGARPRLAR